MEADLNLIISPTFFCYKLPLCYLGLNFRILVKHFLLVFGFHTLLSLFPLIRNKFYYTVDL